MAFLLANPAGICAGMSTTETPTHPCCPRTADSGSESSCICIDRQPAAPTILSTGPVTQLAAAAPASVFVNVPIASPNFQVEEAAPAAPKTIILSIHQLLL
jgi:hypothetical protein